MFRALVLCGCLAAALGGNVRVAKAAPATKSPREATPAANTSAAASIKQRLIGVVSSIASLSSSVAQLEESSRQLEESAKDPAIEHGVSRLAKHMVDLQSKSKQNLQNLTHNVSQKLEELKAKLGDLSAQMVEMLKALSAAPIGGNQAIQRITKFFTAFEKDTNYFTRSIPLAVIYKAGYNLIDMIQFDPSEVNMDKLLSVDITEPLL